jgi:malate synthase
MIAYQRYNALVMLMAGMKHGELTHGAPIGGMAAVMIYPGADPYGRSRYNPLALRAMAIDKLRERLLGLIQFRGTLHDAYRQSWVASPESAYVAAGNAPLRASLDELQAMIDAPRVTVDVKGREVPSAESGLVDAERALLHSRGLLDANGRITPWLLADDGFDSPEKLLTADLWDRIYAVPDGDVTIERVQHAFYMAANYGFQILNGNFAAAIDDYELSLRFMNDLATYRIDVSWLWTLLRHQAVITKDGHVKGPALTEDGVVPATNLFAVAAGTRMTKELFQRVWDAHDAWTEAFFAELDRRGDPGRFDRGKAPIIMDILRRQLLSPRYIQHSARVLFVVAQANAADRAQILDAIFDLPRPQIVERVEAGRMGAAALSAHDYVFDIL